MDEIHADYMSIKSAVIVPGLQALVNGLFYGCATGGVVAVANSLELLSLPSWAVGVTVGSLSGLWAWNKLLDDWRTLLYGVEYETETEMNQAEPVTIELLTDQGRRGQYASLPATQEQLMQLGSGITAGDAFTVGRWTGNGAPFSRSEFEQLRGELLKLGWVEWKSDRNHANGVQITRGGAAVMRHFASMSASGSPTLQRR